MLCFQCWVVSDMDHHFSCGSVISCVMSHFLLPPFVCFPTSGQSCVYQWFPVSSSCLTCCLCPRVVLVCTLFCFCSWISGVLTSAFGFFYFQILLIPIIIFFVIKACFSFSYLSACVYCLCLTTMTCDHNIGCSKPDTIFIH